MNRLIVRSLAGAEIEEAHLWYLERSSTSATRFLEELEAVFDRITANPTQYPEVRRNLRRARIPSFPYGVYFTLVGDRVNVIGVIHASRHPRRWARRS